MKIIKLTFILFVIILWINPTFAQFSDPDVIISISGLSDEYSKRFSENKKVFIEALNNTNLPTDIKPLNIEINYSEKGGYIKVSVNFDVDKIYAENSTYYKHGSQHNLFGKGVSFYFHDELFRCLSNYKLAVARENYSVNTDLANFESVLELKKPSGDIMFIYAYNQLTQYAYPYYFYSNIDIKIKGKMYSTECGNIKTLNDFKHFFVKATEGLDGNKTGAYYFCEFYNIPLD